MALLNIDDLQQALNIDLSDPNGQAVATDLIAAAVAYIEKQVDFKLESGSRTEYFGDGYCHFWLKTGAPVSALSLSVYNSMTAAYDAVASTLVRYSDTGEVSTIAWLPEGFQAVKADYTAGWTSVTFPKDLRQALIDLVGVKLMEVANYSSTADSFNGSGDAEEGGESSTTPTGGLKKYTVGGFTAEYSTAQTDAYWKAKSAQLTRSIGDDVPPGVTNIINLYKRPFAR